LHWQETLTVPEDHSIFFKWEWPALQDQTVGFLGLHWKCAKRNVAESGRDRHCFGTNTGGTQ